MHFRFPVALLKDAGAVEDLREGLKSGAVRDAGLVESF